MNDRNTRRYRGTGKAPPRPAADAWATPEPYLPSSPELIDAVNLAIFLGRPLLIEGEAGSGKSRLAYAVAYELGLPLHVWAVRSTSRAEDGLYRFDAIQRLYDAQTSQELARQGLPVDPTHDPTVLSNYVALGPLGVSFEQPASPAVVLIDEIDKADLDFPNDLLNVLEEGWFVVRETGARLTARQRPIVIITSNREKGNLPLPFLRRCVYFFLKFPENEAELLKIVRRHFPPDGARTLIPQLNRAAVKRFREIRQARLYKKPGTSELLDWVTALHFFADAPYPVRQLESVNTPLPYPGLLYKLQADLPSGPAAA